MLRFATPWFVLAPLCLVLLWRMVGQKLDREGKGLPLFARYYTGLHAVLWLLMLAAFRSTVVDVLMVSDFLDPSTVEEHVRRAMRQDDEDQERLREWRQQASLEEYPLLRLFSLTSPLWVLATFAVCLHHTAAHVLEIKKCLAGRAVAHPEVMNLHDKTVRILALPMVYGLMSYEAVVRMWGVTINRTSVGHHFHSWRERKEFQVEMYDATFMVGDLYESYALFIFGVLTMDVLKRKTEARLELAQRGKGAGAESAEELRSAVGDLVHELKGLTCLGIKLFCLACLAQAVYKLTVVTANYYKFYGFDMFQKESWKQGSHCFFYGAGFVASFAAIGNIVEVEHGFRRSLEEFSPVLKFWGTKVLVSLAFLQTIALKVCPPFSSLSETRGNLFYAALLCLECFLISVFHLKAWAPSESWYHSFDEGFPGRAGAEGHLLLCPVGSPLGYDPVGLEAGRAAAG